MDENWADSVRLLLGFRSAGDAADYGITDTLLRAYSEFSPATAARLIRQVMAPGG